jgi:hypothetical protein
MALGRLERNKKLNDIYRQGSSLHFTFYGQYFTLLHLTVYIIPRHLTILKDMTTYSPRDIMYIVRSVK